MQKLSYKCFMRKVIDNPKRRLLYQTVDRQDEACASHTDESLSLPSVLQRKAPAFVFFPPVISSNSLRSSGKHIEKIFFFHIKIVE